jgi:hypothetical protein
MIMKKSLEKNDLLVITIKKLELPERQISDHWNTILTLIGKSKKSDIATRNKLNI